MAVRKVGPEADAVMAALVELRERGERGRPELVLELVPKRLREAEVDPVAVLDGFRSLGLRADVIAGELPADPGEMVLAVDAGGGTATLRLVPVAAAGGVRERLMPAGRRLGRRWARNFPPVDPGTLAYDSTHRALVASLLDDPDWRSLFASGAALPVGLGAGYDERVVEYPWLFSRGLRGRVLDAGSVLNHRHVLERVLPVVEELTIATLAPEPLAFNSMGISYLYADLRDLPLRDERFDEVVCLSTLEHVGMDNTFYGAAGERAADPSEEAAKALGELLRVVKPGGRIHLSLPWGRREDHGWFRQFDRADVDALLTAAGPLRREEAVFLHTPRGWRRVSAEKAGAATYNAAPDRADDLAVAARAVLCATIYA
jgi:SAM-dependent methyltransferase